MGQTQMEMEMLMLVLALKEILGEQERSNASYTFAYFVVAFVDDDYCRGQRLSA